MKEKRLLYILGLVDDALVEEASQAPKKPRVWVKWAALAACIALLVGTPFAWSLLRRDLGAKAETPNMASPPETTNSSSGAPQSEETTPWATPEDTPDKGYPEVSGDVPEGAEETPEQEMQNETAQWLLSQRIGDLYLGMPEAEITALLGQPDATSNSGPVEIGGMLYYNYFYDLDESETDYRYDLSLTLTDAGEGYVLNEIMTFGACPLRLESGIGQGSTEQEVLDAYPDAPFETEQDGASWISIQDGHLSLRITLENGAVRNIELGSFLPPPELDEEGCEPPTLTEDGLPNWVPCGGEMTLYKADGSSVTVREREAKRIETQMNIEQLRPLDSEVGELTVEIDLGSGWRAALRMDGTEAGTVTSDDGTYYEVIFPAGMEQTVRELLDG